MSSTTPPASDASISKHEAAITTIHISGLAVHLHGLDLHPPSTPLTCVHLLHPRLQTHASMSPMSHALLTNISASESPIITATFDARNHGTRLAHAPANHSWSSGNPTHAQDLFSIYHGTAIDLAMVVDYLPAYLRRTITRHVVVGVSLGGHAAFLAMAVPKVSAVASVIGCVDFRRLMRHRAERCGVEVEGDLEGLEEALKGVDPAARGMEVVGGLWRGKKVLALFGGSDGLVPGECSRGFLDEVREGGGVDVRVVVVEGVGHECTKEMVGMVVGFVRECVGGGGGGGRPVI